MRILYVISVLSHGSGGHTHSLNHISKEVAQNIDVQIITIGPGKIPVLIKNPHYNSSLFFNGFNFIEIFKKFKNIRNSFNPDVIHCFDNNAYNIIKLINWKKKTLIVNKCGGPNPTNYPLVENLILFSKENLKWFNENQKFNSVNKFLISNRAAQVSTITQKEYPYDNSYFNFVRIARISEAYETSINQSIDLVKELNKKGLRVKLYIIGAIQSKSIYNKIIERLDNIEYVRVITDSKFTSEASKMLYLADAVIATGRGIMEGASLGKPLLTPAQNSALPILINEDNFTTFFTTNFSERNVASNEDLDNNLNLVIDMIANKSDLNKYRKISISFFKEHFDIKHAGVKYLIVYKSKSENTIPFYKDIKLKIQTYYRFYKGYKNLLNKECTF